MIEKQSYPCFIASGITQGEKRVELSSWYEILDFSENKHED